MKAVKAIMAPLLVLQQLPSTTPSVPAWKSDRIWQCPLISAASACVLPQQHRLLAAAAPEPVSQANSSSKGLLDLLLPDFLDDSQEISDTDVEGEWDGAGALGLAGGRRDRFQALWSHVNSCEDYILCVKDIAALYAFPLDKCQKLAIEAFLKGLSLVVCAPTSSGKTLVAEAAAVATLIKGKKLFYTTPLKALSNQKLREFRAMFGEENVGLLTGDAAVNRDAPIVVMTTEILRNMLYQSVGSQEEGSLLDNVDAVVLDEVHYLSDISRGTVWEETVIYCPEDISLICLSATVANPEELAGWIAQVHGPTELVTSSRRPVPLMWHFSTRHALLPLLNEECSAINRRLLMSKRLQQKGSDPFWDEDAEEKSREKQGFGRNRANQRQLGSQTKKGRKGGEGRISEEELHFLRRRQVPQVSDTLHQLKDRDMLPAIWFIFSRRGCDTATRYLQEVQLLSDDEIRKVELALSSFREIYPEAVRESAVKSLLCGVAAHHAGCLPTWKSFLEDLFQNGLIKVVFATETLAAGVNMPARTTVLSSMSKRGDDGQMLLSSNSMLQMAGRAGRRGIDSQGHVVVVQTPFEGAEECCQLLFAGPDPLVSQFSATYGMALNLLGGSKVKGDWSSKDSSQEVKPVQRRRNLGEARALIEKSFGNYVGSEVMVTAKQQLARLQQDIKRLDQEISWNQSQGVKDGLLLDEWQQYSEAKTDVQEAKRGMRELRAKVETMRLTMVHPLLEQSEDKSLPYIFLAYSDHQTGHEQVFSALYVCSVPRPSCLPDDPITGVAGTGLSGGEEMEIDDFEDNPASSGRDTSTAVTSDADQSSVDLEQLYHAALGSDNCWYIFTGRSVKSISKSCFVSKDSTSSLRLKSLLRDKLRSTSTSWQNLGKSGRSSRSSVWYAESSMDTWGWSIEVPPLNELMDVHPIPEELHQVEKLLSDQRKKVSRLRKAMKTLAGYRVEKQFRTLQKSRAEKLSRLQAKASRIAARITKMQPSGWKEFLQVVKVLEAAEALNPENQALLELGELSASIRGENELWLGLVFRHKDLPSLRPEELAAVCGSLVSDGIKTRPENGSSDVYQVSKVVSQWVEDIEETRLWLQRLQMEHGVEISCEIDTQFAGLVEAWAAGVTWKELMVDTAMDEGDVARLLRRSVDLLAQIPRLPHIDSQLAKNARLAAVVMDRAPISELIG